MVPTKLETKISISPSFMCWKCHFKTCFIQIRETGILFASFLLRRHQSIWLKSITFGFFIVTLKIEKNNWPEPFKRSIIEKYNIYWCFPNLDYSEGNAFVVEGDYAWVPGKAQTILICSFWTLWQSITVLTYIKYQLDADVCLLSGFSGMQPPTTWAGDIIDVLLKSV